jgi:histidine triad (HIT) family protein
VTARLLLYLARLPLARLGLGWAFAHLHFALPLRRLRETETLIAFPHPRPSYPTHILLVPKKAIASPGSITRIDAPFLADVFLTAHELAAEFKLDSSGWPRPGRGWRLVLNGGAYQDVPQLHFHLIAS